MGENKVIARVENTEITEQTVAQFLGGLDPQLAMQLANEEGQKRVVDELINQEVIYLDAKENGLDKEEGFLKELEQVKEGLLKQYAVNKVVSDISISEEEVRKYYDENQEIFDAGVEITASHILVEDEEEAKSLIEEINNGLDFAEAAKKHSTCQSKANGGNLGSFGKGRMVPEFEEVAFALEVGEMSKEPVKSEFGYHIVLVHDKEDGGVKGFDEVKDQLTNQLLGMKQQEAYLRKTDELKAKYKVENNL